MEISTWIFSYINTKDNHGMLLENLLDYKGQFDCNLNNIIKLLFTVCKHFVFTNRKMEGVKYERVTFNHRKRIM